MQIFFKDTVKKEVQEIKLNRIEVSELEGLGKDDRAPHKIELIKAQKKLMIFNTPKQWSQESSSFSPPAAWLIGIASSHSYGDKEISWLRLTVSGKVPIRRSGWKT